MHEKTIRKWNWFLFIGVMCAAVILLVVLLRQGIADSKSYRNSRLKEYEQTLNDDFTGNETGIIRFTINNSGIYINVDPKIVPADEYGLVANAWARKLSENMLSGRPATASVMVGKDVVLIVSYSRARGFY